MDADRKEGSNRAGFLMKRMEAVGIMALPIRSCGRDERVSADPIHFRCSGTLRHGVLRAWLRS